MREKDITQPVIDKCKQIAELWRMEVEKFGWFSLDCDPSPFCLDNYTFWKEGGCIHQATHDLLAPNQVTVFKEDEWFPIPSISDCLEKLGERNEFMPDCYSKKDFNRSLLNIFKNYIEGKFTVEEVHCWLLSALLGVLRDAESWDYRTFHPRDGREK